MAKAQDAKTNDAVKDTATKTTAKKTATKKPATKAKAKKEEVAEEVVETEEVEELEMDEAPEESNGLITEDEIADVATIIEEVFRRKQVNKMSYDEKKEVYGSTPTAKDKLSRNVNNRAKSRTDWRREEFQELLLATNPRKSIIKWVLVEGVEEDEKYGLCMITRLMNKDPYVDQNRGEFKIKIPVSEFAMFNPNDKSFADKEKGYFYFTREIDKWVGNRVQVVIYSVDEKSRTAMASRLAASAKLSSFYFRGKKPKYKAGDILTGQVMSTKVDKITLSVYGQDFKVKTDEATWTAALPLYEEFKVGQYVDVKILDVDNSLEWNVNGHEYKLTKIEGSIKQASENPNIAYYDDFEIGGKYKGKVKAQTADGEKTFVVLQNKVLVMCDTPLIGQLGDNVYVLITKKNDKDHQFWGKILRTDL